MNQREKWEISGLSVQYGSKSMCIPSVVSSQWPTTICPLRLQCAHKSQGRWSKKMQIKSLDIHQLFNRDSYLKLRQGRLDIIHYCRIYRLLILHLRIKSPFKAVLDNSCRLHTPGFADPIGWRSEYSWC